LNKIPGKLTSVDSVPVRVLHQLLSWRVPRRMGGTGIRKPEEH
jgi:hypothetical protein